MLAGAALRAHADPQQQIRRQFDGEGPGRLDETELQIACSKRQQQEILQNVVDAGLEAPASIE